MVLHVYLFAIRPKTTKPTLPLPEHLFVCVSTHRVGVLSNTCSCVALCVALC